MTRRSSANNFDDDDAAPTGKVRLDKWLWAARFFKTRALAAEAVDGGKVDVNGDRAKRSRLVQVSDTVQLRSGPLQWQLVVRDIAHRRGSATVAQGLYDEIAESKRVREQLTAQLRSMETGFAHGDDRPGKKDRREIRRLKGDA